MVRSLVVSKLSMKTEPIRILCDADESPTQANGPKLVVHWPGVTNMQQDQSIRLRQVLGFSETITNQQSMRFSGDESVTLGLAAGNGSNSAPLEEVDHDPICLVESHESEPSTGSQVVHLGCGYLPKHPAGLISVSPGSPRPSVAHWKSHIRP
jgi:hypothetical protein